MTPVTPCRVLVMGLGNPDRGDDGVGVRVAQRLAGRLPDGAGLRIGGRDALALIDDWAGYDALVVIDAAAPMGVPGRLHRLTPGDAVPSEAPLSGHALGLLDALALARTLQLPVPATVVIHTVEAEDFTRGAPLGPAVVAAVPEAVERVAGEVARLHRGG